MAGTPYVPSSRLERFAGSGVCRRRMGGRPRRGRRLLHGHHVLPAVAVQVLGAAAGDEAVSTRLRPGRQLAEIKTTDLADGPPPAWRRLLRAAVLPVLCVAVLPAGWWLSAAVAVLLLCTCLVTSDRRGLADRLAGLRDYQTDLVPYRPDPAPGEAVA